MAFHSYHLRHSILTCLYTSLRGGPSSGVELGGLREVSRIRALSVQDRLNACLDYAGLGSNGRGTK